MKISRFVLAATLLVVAGIAPVARGQNGNSRVFGDLLQRIPEHANVLLLINVDGLCDSPIGKRENWRAKVAQGLHGPLGLSADVDKIAVAVGMDFQTMQERWKVGLAQRPKAATNPAALAAREGGFVDTIEKMPVVWTPRGFVLFAFPDNLVGFASPVDRQGIARWFESALWHPRKFPPGYADRAVFRADAGAQVVLAFNLANCVATEQVEPWLNAIPIMKKTNTDPKLLAPRLASVKSAFLTVTANQNLEATLRIDFERPVDYTTQVARELILNLLEDFGAELPEVKTWTLSFDRKTPAVEMTGRFSEASLAKVVSLAHPPQLSAETPYTRAVVAEPKPAEPAKPAPSKNDGASASQAYYRSVVALIEGIKTIDRPTYRATKLWYDKYAKQIEELPILGVDRELLDWGSAAARTLREMSSGINYYSQNQKYTLAATPSGNYGGYGYYNNNSRSYDASVIKKQSDASMSVDLDSRWQGLQTSVADMRRKMVEKYMVDF
jgi:hypothetical protein